jgi:predicted metal-dependent hydrolase
MSKHKVKNPTRLDWLAIRTGVVETENPRSRRRRTERLKEKRAREDITERIERYVLKHKVDYRAVLEQFMLLQTTDELTANWKEVSELWFADS